MTSETPRYLPPDALESWLEEICAAMDVEEDVDIGALLDLTKDVAHNVARPAGPLTTFVLGLALGRQTAPGQAATEFDRLSEILRTMALREE